MVADCIRFDSLMLGLYALILGRNPGAATRGAISLIEYLTFAGLLVLAFTDIPVLRGS